MLFSDKIKELRIASGKGQKEMARVIGVDVPAYSRYEHGERRPKRDQVLTLARFFNTDADELIAMWLADEAYSRIAQDRMSSRAAAMLSTMLSREKETAEENATTPSAHDAPHVKRDLISKMGRTVMPHYELGDAATVMQRIEDESIDCIVTTPPYWRRRDKGTESITAANADEYIQQLLTVTAQAWRVLKPQGSLWLNMGDDTMGQFVQGLPWRTVLAMIDQQGWRLVNEVVWNKVTTTPQGSQDHLRKVHESMFHLVKGDDFYYNDEELRRTYALIVRNDLMASGTAKRSGGAGERYIKKIQESDALSAQEKREALRELAAALRRLNAGDVDELRLFLRENREQSLEDDSAKAKSINDKGYYIQTRSAQGAIPSDVWKIATPRKVIAHYTVAPDTLYRLPLVATCPPGGLVLDPWCGTGTACKIAYGMNLRSIGIDVNANYLRRAKDGIELKPLSLF